MIGRRGFLGGLAAMTWGDRTQRAGTGRQPAPMNAPPAQPLGIGVQPGTPNIIRARIVEILGSAAPPGSGLFVYDSTGALIAAIVGANGTDPIHGTQVFKGIDSTDGTQVAVLIGRQLQWLTPSDAALNPPALYGVPSGTNGNALFLTTAQGKVGGVAAAISLYDSNASSTVPAIPAGGPGIFIPAACPVVADTWNAVTFQNGWANSGSGPNMQYRKSPVNNMVELIGDMTAGTLTSPTTIFNLPAAYRPAKAQTCLPVASGGGAGLVVGTSRFVFNTNGDVTATGMAGFTAAGRLFLRYTMSLDA